MTAQTPIRQADAPRPDLIVRDRRFDRTMRERGVDPFAAAWMAALSASFPKGEAMFIEALRLFRDDVPEALAAEIRSFIRQEVNHSREHLAFNRAVTASGYDMTEINARVARLVELANSQPPLMRLAITASLEHFTAMGAHVFLIDPDSLASAGMGDPELWLWHSVEEIEHKGVAYDTWNHATRELPALRRYLMRCAIMLRVTFRFFRNRTRDALDLLAQDGIRGPRAWWGLAKYLVARPGLMRRILPHWITWFRPGFHPWDLDDRALIARYDNDFAAIDPTGKAA